MRRKDARKVEKEEQGQAETCKDRLKPALVSHLQVQHVDGLQEKLAPCIMEVSTHLAQEWQGLPTSLPPPTDRRSQQREATACSSCWCLTLTFQSMKRM